MTTFSRRGAAIVAASIAALVPATAQATPYIPTGAECELHVNTGSLNVGQALEDSTGAFFDVQDYALLDDGATVTPTAAVDASDAYDGFGQLFVGATEDSTSAYTDADALGCAQEADGRQTRFAQVTNADGLQVQRRIYVSATSAGARLLDSVTNPTDAPVTTSVWFGDVTTQDSGDLGSDGDTTVRQTSSGATDPSTADRWAVTTDQEDSGGSDPAIAHVWGGEGAATPATFVRFGAQTGGAPALDDSTQMISQDQLGWGWQNVTVPAHGTVSFATWELLGVTAENTPATQFPVAAAAAQSLESAAPARLYDGLTADQIASVRNWAHPLPTASIAAVTGATSGTATSLSATGVAFDGGLSQCADGTLTWDFGDGSTATGATVNHQFAAGTAHVKLTAKNACGGSVSRTVDFDVAAPAPAATPTPTPAPAATLTSAPTASLFVAPKLSEHRLRNLGVGAIVTGTADGSVRVVVSAKGIKRTKTVDVKAGAATTVRVRFAKADLPLLPSTDELTVSAKYTSGKTVVTKKLTIPVSH